ncbi:MAG: hypothetical protein QOJ14_1837, partial [Thermoleophilaceae bacterium]|nr:hypothetical protein [Thermoleophilaceae bacterium]
MRRLASATLAVAGLALGGAAGASAASPVPVHIEFQAFNPTPQDALPGETVQWENVSTRRHTVTADDGSFDSGDVFGGDRFAWKFATVGAYGYHCRVHPGMTGEIDVRRVTLGVMPTGLVPSGQKVPVKGRTADSVLPVQIERSTGGAFQTVATAVPAPDGTWNADVTAEKTAQYRASTP